ncbi:MAG: DUF4269 domain-containing protein [Deltaproteobacteria bacterium]|nr:DUF4269 domain-containing protein [Deltaproteobacteria bacterium]
MAFDFGSIEYLADGSHRQKRAYLALRELDLFTSLAQWTGDEMELGSGSALAGSIPLDLGVAESDLDIVTFSTDLKQTATLFREKFSARQNFSSSRGIVLGAATLVTRFDFGGESFEIFTQNVPLPLQNAIVHMLVEERLLLLGGLKFREKIMALREQGEKTEPAFGKVLGLEEPYRELLQLEELSDSELRLKFSNRF